MKQFLVRINNDGKKEIFDPVRKIYVIMTPEEIVRQKLIVYLNKEKNVPFSLMGVEKSIIVNKLVKRPDLIIFNRSGKVILIAECKAPNVTITQSVLDQVVRYNMTLKSDYLLLTNGVSFICLDCREGKFNIVDINYWKFDR